MYRSGMEVDILNFQLPVMSSDGVRQFSWGRGGDRDRGRGRGRGSINKGRRKEEGEDKEKHGGETGHELPVSMATEAGLW